MRGKAQILIDMGIGKIRNIVLNYASLQVRLWARQVP